jgi:hypothetical protein
MRREGETPFVARAYASGTLGWYFMWLAAALLSFYDDICDGGKRCVPFSWSAIPLFVSITAINIACYYYLKSVEVRSVALFSKYRSISYAKDLLFTGLLMIPMPLLLAVGRGSAFGTILMLFLHWLYLLIFGNYLLRKIKIVD